VLGLEQYGLPVQVAAVVIPAAVYFLLLGLLNSQRTPQLLRSRTDFILLILAFSPLFFMPLLISLGAASWTFVVVLALVALGTMYMAPSAKGHWVIYNITLPEVLRCAERALRGLDISFRREGRRLILDGRDVTVSFGTLPLLRNVSITAEGAGLAGFDAAFADALGRQLGSVQAETTPMAAAFLLISVVMLVTPLSFVAERMPDMVRLIGDLLK
jgi:hypothetical protein